MRGPQPVRCPSCQRAYSPSERFCTDCGMPLIQSGGEEPADERRRRARKIKPEYAEGLPVEVAAANSQHEAEFIAALLLEEGIPSMFRTRIAGYGPMVGRREVLVPESGAQAAREILAPRAER